MNSPGRTATVCFALAALAAPAPAAEKIAALDQTWRWVTNERFELLTNGSERRGREAIEQLESFRAALRQLNGGEIAEASSPIRVLLFNRVWDFEPYQVRDAHGKPERFDGIFMRRGETSYIALSGEYRDSLPHLVYHEFAHFLIAAQLGRLPPWLAEGLAEYFAGFRYLERARRVEIGRPLAEHMRFLNASPHVPLDQLLRTDYASPEFAREVPRALFYAKSWLLVHYLQVGAPERAGTLARFVRLLDSGTKPIPALEKAAGTTLRRLDDELTAYQRKSLMRFATFELDAGAPEIALATRLATREEVAYRLGEYLLALDGSRRTEAEAHFAASGRPAPGIEAVYSAFVPESGAAAIAALPPTLEELRASVTAAPESAMAQSRLAIEIYRQQADAAVPDAEQLAEARQALRTAITIEPEVFEYATDLLRVHEIGSSTEGLAESLAALARALETTPEHLDLRLGYARLLARAGQREEARRIAHEWAVERGPVVAHDGFARLLAQLDGERAIELAREGRIEEAESLLVARIAATPQPDWRDQLERSLATIRASGEHNRARATYSRAVELSKTGRLEEAAGVLRALVASRPPAPIDELAATALENLEVYLEARRKASRSPPGSGS